MRLDTPTFDRFDVVVVPFPFTDRQANKRRPAVVLGSVGPDQHVLAMITTAEGWNTDVPVTDLDAAGLPVPSVVRLKLLTLDSHLILRVSGRLSAKDENNLKRQLKQTLGL